MPFLESYKKDEQWTNIQAFQVRRLNPSEVIDKVTKILGAEKFELERQDGTTWILRSNRRLEPEELKQLQGQRSARPLRNDIAGHGFHPTVVDNNSRVIIVDGGTATGGSMRLSQTYNNDGAGLQKVGSSGYASVNRDDNGAPFTGIAISGPQLVDLSGITIPKSQSPAPEPESAQPRAPLTDQPAPTSTDMAPPPGFHKPKRQGTLSSIKDGIVRRLSGVWGGNKNNSNLNAANFNANQSIVINSGPGSWYPTNTNPPPQRPTATGSVV